MFALSRIGQKLVYMYLDRMVLLRLSNSPTVEEDNRKLYDKKERKSHSLFDGKGRRR